MSCLLLRKILDPNPNPCLVFVNRSTCSVINGYKTYFVLFHGNSHAAPWRPIIPDVKTHPDIDRHTLLPRPQPPSGSGCPRGPGVPAWLSCAAPLASASSLESSSWSETGDWPSSSRLPCMQWLLFTSGRK